MRRGKLRPNIRSRRLDRPAEAGDSPARFSTRAIDRAAELIKSVNDDLRDSQVELTFFLGAALFVIVTTLGGTSPITSADQYTWP